MKRKPRPMRISLLVAIGRIGITQIEVAKRAGIGDDTLSEILRNRRDPKPETMEKLAVALNTTVEALFPEEVLHA